jgi:hypothetical protein
LNINEIIHQIGQKEQQLETEASSEYMADLINLYNKAIEYYSAVGDKSDSQNS